MKMTINEFRSIVRKQLYHMLLEQKDEQPETGEEAEEKKPDDEESDQPEESDRKDDEEDSPRPEPDDEESSSEDGDPPSDDLSSKPRPVNREQALSAAHSVIEANLIAIRNSNEWTAEGQITAKVIFSSDGREVHTVASLTGDGAQAMKLEADRLVKSYQFPEGISGSAIIEFTIPRLESSLS
jgi:hypothetical protein